MQVSGVIRIDGSVQYYGYEPMRARLLAIETKKIGRRPMLMVLSFAGDVYYTNGGRNYCRAHTVVVELKALKRLGDTWAFEIKDGGAHIEWDSIKTMAVKKAVDMLSGK